MIAHYQAISKCLDMARATKEYDQGKGNQREWGGGVPETPQNEQPQCANGRNAQPQLQMPEFQDDQGKHAMR